MIGTTSRYRQTQKPKRLTREEEYDLIQRVKAGDERALRKLISRIRGLIYKEVDRYGSQVDRRLLVAAGETAVFIAARGFDLSTGNRFSTYLVPTIRTEVRNSFCDETGTSRQTLINLGKISTASAALNYELGREPTVEEIAERSNLSKQQILNAWRRKSFTQPLSLNSRLDEDCPEWLDSQIDKSVDVWCNSEETEIAEILEQLQSAGHLEERQVTILIARNQDYTNKDLGEIFGITSERVRQLFRDAKKTLTAFDTGTLETEPTPVSSTVPAVIHHSIDPVGEGDQLSLDLPAPRKVRESALKRVDASRLGGRIGKIIQQIFKQTNKESHIHDHGELTNAQEHILVFRRHSNHGLVDVAGHRLTSENQRCNQLARVQDPWRGYLGFSPIILNMLLLPLAFVSQSIRGFQDNDKPNKRRSMMSFFTTGVFQDVGIGYRKEHPRPPNDFPDSIESLN